MRTTVTIEDELMEEAMRLTGLDDRGAVIRAAIKSLIEREASRRLALLGGTMPNLKPIPRRQSTL